MSKLMIGWGEADITPDLNGKLIPLSGQYYARYAKGIHSRLKNVVVAISSGDEYFITGSVDNVGCEKSFHDRLCAEVAKLAPEIDGSRIFLNAIHTHSAPRLRLGEEEPADPGVLSIGEYTESVIPVVVQNIVNAWRSRKPGGIIRGFGNARIGHCRRAVYRDGTAEMYGDTTREDFVGMEAGEDSGVEMLFTCDESGKKTGMLLNAACPSQTMEATYLVSSDFAGATRELLKQEFGEDFHTIYEISPAGCQSPRDLVRHYTAEPDFWHADGVDVLARRLFAAVKNADLGTPEFAPELRHVTRQVALPRRRVSYRDFMAATAELERLTKIMPEDKAFEEFCAEVHANEKLDGPGPYDSKLHHFVLIRNAKAVVRRYNEQNAAPELHFDMHVVRLGDAVIASNPFELYLYYGQNIKARSHAGQTFLVQLSCGADIHAGYLPSPDAERFGGYGGIVCNGQVGSDGGYKLADVTVETINSLFD